MSPLGLFDGHVSYSHLVVKSDVGEVKDIEAQKQTRKEKSGSSTIKKINFSSFDVLNCKPVNPN